MSLSVAQRISVDIVTVLCIQPTLSKIWKQQQMVQKFPGIFSGNSRNWWISEIRTFQPKILEILGEKFNWKKTSGKIFVKIWVYLARLSSFWKFLKMLFHLLLEVDEKSNCVKGWNITGFAIFLLCLVYLPGDCLSHKYQSTPNAYYCTILCFLGLQSWLV